MSFILSALSVKPPGPETGPARTTVLTISPSSGDVAGGTPVTITGTTITSEAQIDTALAAITTSF